jgi:NAD+ kinase
MVIRLLSHWYIVCYVSQVPDDARSNAWVSFDGKKRQQLCKGESVRICMSEHPMPTVNKHDQTDDWFGSLSRCFGWNQRIEQRSISFLM